MAVGTDPPWPYDFSIDGTGVMTVKTLKEEVTTDILGNAIARVIKRVPDFEIQGQSQVSPRLDTGDLLGVYGSPEEEVPWVGLGFDTTGGYGLQEQLETRSDRYYYASNVDARVPGRIMPGPALTTHTLTGSAGVVRAMAVMSDGGTDTLYVGMGRYVYASTDGSSFTQVRDMGASRVATSMVVFQGTQSKPALYVGVEAGQGYWTYINGTGWTEDGDEGVHFAVANDELWRGYLDTNTWKVQKSTDGGATATWSGPITIGEGSTKITEMVKYDDRIYIFKENQLYTLVANASSIDEEVWPDSFETKNALTGVGTSTWAGRMYMVIPDAGLYEYQLSGSDQFVQPMGPGLLATNDSPVRGTITAVVGDRDYYLYAAIQNEDGNSYLLAWDRANNAWHGSLVNLGAVTVRKMMISHKITTNPKLYIGTDATVASILLPREGRDPSQDSNVTFATNGQLYLPRFTGLLPFVSKSYLANSLSGSNLSSSNYVTVYYRRTTSGSYTALGSNFTSITRKDFPTSGVKSELLDVYLDIFGSASSPPKVASWTLHYAVRPTFKRRFRATVHAGTGLALNDGTPDTQTHEAIRQVILDTLDSGPVEIIGPDGKSYTVLFKGQDYSETPLAFNLGDEYESAIAILATEYGATNVQGTYARMERYTYLSLQGYTYASLENL